MLDLELHWIRTGFGAVLELLTWSGSGAALELQWIWSCTGFGAALDLEQRWNVELHWSRTGTGMRCWNAVLECSAALERTGSGAALEPHWIWNCTASGSALNLELHWIWTCSGARAALELGDALELQ